MGQPNGTALGLVPFLLHRWRRRAYIIGGGQETKMEILAERTHKMKPPGFYCYLIAFLMASFAWAQEAELNGSVRDSSGAVVPNAAVRALNKGTGINRT